MRRTKFCTALHWLHNATCILVWPPYLLLSNTDFSIQLCFSDYLLYGHTVYVLYNPYSIGRHSMSTIHLGFHK